MYINKLMKKMFKNTSNICISNCWLYFDSFGGSSEFPDVQKMLGLGSSEPSTESGAKPVSARETIVKYMMNEREVEFTDISKLK